MADLKGKTALVTGATSGIGLEAAVSLAKMGGRVLMVGRDPKKTDEKVAEVKRRAGSELVEPLLCDFEKQADVRRLADEVRKKTDRIDVLVNNAGAVNDQRRLTADGIEATFAVNHLGYFLLTNLVLDLVKKAAPSRIVCVASAGHYRGDMNFDDLNYERGYQIMRAYGRSKLGNVLFTRELAKRLEGTGVTVNCLHPGVVATNIWSGAPWFVRPLLEVGKKLFMISPEEGGSRIVYLATSPEVADKTGLYFDKNQPKKESRLARDDGLASKLWDVSAKLVHLSA